MEAAVSFIKEMTINAEKGQETAGSGADMLPQLIARRGWETQLDLHSVFPNWREIVDPETAGHCRPLKIRRGVLWLEVENSAWLQQLQLPEAPSSGNHQRHSEKIQLCRISN